MSGAIDPDALAIRLESNDGPTIVSLQAGEVNTGAFDPFLPAIEAARRNGAWVHIDGAFGLWARASAKYRDQTHGVELADSWATDGHKWLNVPYDSGYAFVKNRDAHRRAFSHKTEYLMQSQTQRDAVDWTPEHSRRARCFATYAALRNQGRRGIADLVDRCCRNAQALIEGAARLSGVEVVRPAIINQGLLRFHPRKPGATVEDSDQYTQEVIAAIERSGEALFTSTRFEGRTCMRVSVSNWQTTDQDIERVLVVMRQILG
jgi:glutamate/tyrosine decarboxylase-like PLP-dependent enzyme